MSTTERTAPPTILPIRHRAEGAKPDPFGPATLADAYACGLVNARHAAREEMARLAIKLREDGGKGSHAARRAVVLADVALQERLTTLIGRAGR